MKARMETIIASLRSQDHHSRGRSRIAWNRRERGGRRTSRDMKSGRKKNTSQARYMITIEKRTSNVRYDGGTKLA